ncbi:Lrp/AsnC family transcriptional regulator [Halosegnis longus]|uniref:Lrp/AsnC family transcriptional regulator n=1 Tax=Halosegnis longus TaxID=2216012 RepID=A0AAJ4RAY2_9EURY|nr:MULTISPECIES: Lrp/AsnC family transcriptional regulator [Halobacteriales]RNJ27437.1 Lrp/AsnC family transcriptional regulator [Salella cibi]
MSEPSPRSETDPVGRAAIDGARRAERAGYVEGYAPLIDFDALDARTVVVRLQVAPTALDGVVETLADHAVTVFETTGRLNVFAICRFPTDDRRDAFLATLAGDDCVRDVQTNPALRTVVEGDATSLL